MPARKVRTAVAFPADLLEAMQLAASRRAGIAAEFARMATDPLYQQEAFQIAEEFAKTDWEALRNTERTA